jgi:molybdenum cofactor cytidylyltransferase
VKFGPAPLDEAEGAIAAHSIRIPGLELRKGALVDTGALIALRQAGISEIVVARLEPDDVTEDAAAAALAIAIAGPQVTVERAFTGRSNLFAACAGVVRVDRARIDALNTVDEAVTVATLDQYRSVQAGEMVATVKIIPFAVAGAAFGAAMDAAEPLVEVVPYRIRRATLIATLLPGLPEKVLAKTRRVTAARLASAGAELTDEARVPHTTEAVADALRKAAADGAELALVFGASAIADRRDVIPAGIEAAGGVVEHFGMPVDPGNLMLVGHVGDMPVLGAPGCARSPKENGFDWVLHRLLAGLPVTRADIVGMGVGGLLMEIATRPQPRDPVEIPTPPRVAAVVLAAGRGTRMGGANKLASPLDGEPLLRRVVASAFASSLRPVVVVTGHEPERAKAVLDGLDVSFVHNPDYAEGISTSLATGIKALPEDVAAAAVLLGDMPRVSPDLIDRLAQALNPEAGGLIAVPVREGRRGNPVVWSRRFFPELITLEGDVGARHLIGANAEAVVEVPVDDDDAFIDVDTRDALELLELHMIAERSDVDASAALDGMQSEDA